MFDCRSSVCGTRADVDHFRIFARDGGLSMGLSLEPGTVISLLGVEVCQLYDLLVYDLSRIARERIQKMKPVQPDLKRNIRMQRLEITRFLRLVLGSAESMRGEKLRSSIAMILHCLPKLMDPLLMYGWNSVHQKDYNGYEIYHGVLEWRWLVMLLVKEASDTRAETIDAAGMKANRCPLSLAKMYRELMVDMLELVFHQFRINTAEDLVCESPFQCSCVKYMWLGLMVLAHESNGELDFWACLGENMPPALKDRNDAYLFKIWLLNALARFYGKQGSPDKDEVPIVTLPHNYSIVEDVVKEFLRTECKEEQIRVFLILLKPIITGLWPVRHEIVITVWDYFSVRLNSPFQLKCDPLTTMGCVSRSVSGFIEQAGTLAAPDSTLDNLDLKSNSFRMFLILLASVIRHYTEQSLKTKVQITFNRIFLKLGPNKYENLTAQGIYNLGLLLLTMINATTYQEDYPRVSKQMQMLRIVGDEPANLPVSAAINRIVIATQAHMALLVSFGGSKFDKSAHVGAFLQKIETAHRKYGNRLLPAMDVIAEGMSVMFEEAMAKQCFSRGDRSLIGSWMVIYLRHCSAEKWRKLLDAVSSALQHQTACADNDFLKAVNEHVFPFVKEQFLKSDPAPTCIAHIAARLTIQMGANGASDGPASSSLALFNTFTNCTVAHADQVLAYLKEVTKSSKMLTLVDEKIIIRQWLKMAFYYDQQCLLDLSRVVHGLGEFKALCEIPEYEMFEGKAVPIELFFRFVGKRFREADSAMQMELKMKLHTLFQHFDKWIPDPKGIIRQRILAVLVLALKECPQAFYIKSNSTCLYHLAFQHYFLPFAVLTDRNVQPDFIEDMTRVWHKVMDILGKMDYGSNYTIGDSVNNMLVKWIPQFAKLPKPADAIRPFMLFFCSHNEDLVLYAMPRFVTVFVDLQRCLPKANAMQGMQMLQRLLENLLLRKDYGKIALFIRSTGLPITLHAFMCNETFPTRAIAMEMLFDMVDSTDGPSNMVKNEMRATLAAFTRKYLPLAAEVYFTFMCRLADRNPSFVRSLIELVREELTQAEKMRGQGTDHFLRSELHRLEGAVDASFNKMLLNNVQKQSGSR